jgi:hypothetical protein
MAPALLVDLGLEGTASATNVLIPRREVSESKGATIRDDPPSDLPIKILTG